MSTYYDERTARRVILTPAEAAVAAQVGISRHLAALRAGSHDRAGADAERGWRFHIEGAGGEMAFAKVAGIYWPCSNGTYHEQPDVGDYEVRCRDKHDWDLIIRPNDPSGIYVLVTGSMPYYLVHGWASWPEARRDDYWKTPNSRPPAWFIPQSALQPIDQLPHRGVDSL